MATGNGHLQPTAHDCEVIARRFFGNGEKQRYLGWKDLSAQEREGLVREWQERTAGEAVEDHRIAQQVEARMAAASEPPERPKVKVKDLADLVWNLEQEGQVQVTAKTLVLVVKMFNEELSRAINKREANTRAYIDEQLERVRADAHERYKAEVRMKNAEVSALRTHNDALAWQLSEAQAALADRAVRPPSAKLYYQPRRNGNGAHDDD